MIQYAEIIEWCKRNGIKHQLAQAGATHSTAQMLLVDMEKSEHCDRPSWKHYVRYNNGVLDLSGLDKHPKWEA